MEPQESNKDNESQESPKVGNELTPELSAQLSDYHKALASEFEIANKELTSNSDVIDLKDYWKKKVPDAAAQVAWLAMHAHSEGIRLSANKYILTEAFSETGSDELSEILKKLTANTV